MSKRQVVDSSYMQSTIKDAIELEESSRKRVFLRNLGTCPRSRLKTVSRLKFQSSQPIRTSEIDPVTAVGA